jgi:hypothetical protein
LRQQIKQPVQELWLVGYQGLTAVLTGGKKLNFVFSFLLIFFSFFLTKRIGMKELAEFNFFSARIVLKLR